MVKHADASGTLALSRRPLARSVTGSPAFSGPNMLPRLVAQPAEIAQARVFERLLQAESADLRELAHRIAADEQHDDARPSEELTQIRTRIDEVDGLLQALRGRFPHPAPEGQPA